MMTYSLLTRLILCVSIGFFVAAQQPNAARDQSTPPLASEGKSAVAQSTVTKKSISMEAAIAVALAGIKASQEMKCNIAIAVLDQSGLPLVILRSDEGTEQFFEACQQKAWTTIAFRGTSTKDLFERIKKNQGDPNEATYSSFSLAPFVHKALFFMGGVPIKSDNELVGAVGVAGCVSGIDDDAIARKAAAAFSEQK